MAGEAVPLDEEERQAAIRRALLVFAAGGNLHRDPTLGDPAVAELARDIDSPARREALASALQSLETEEAAGLLADPHLAWSAYACGLLADALGED